MVGEACKLVSKFRDVAKYIKNPPKAKEKVIQFGGNTSNNRDTVSVLLDVRTRWNSALDMLLSMLKIKPALVTFLLHLETSDGRKEFHNKKLRSISEVEWIFIESLCNVLTPFKNATCLLSGDSYPTFTQALPTLRKIKSFLMEGAEGNLLSIYSTCKPIADYMNKYDSEDHMMRIVRRLKTCCAVLLEQFKKRFQGLNLNILWVTFLDPRCRKMKHLCSNEYKTAKMKFRKDVTALTMPIVARLPVTESAKEREYDNDPYLGSLYDSPSTSVCSISNESIQGANETIHRSSVQREIENYLDPQLIVPPTTDPLMWWNQNKCQFPKIAVAARKWLCVPASSTPAERVFSHCGVALSTKRASMRGDALMNQVLLKNNLKHVTLTMEDIKSSFLSSA